MKRHLTTITTLCLALAAALAFYLVSFHVAQERVEIAALQGSIARDTDDMRALQAEYGKRARLPQLEHWNGELASVSASSIGMDAPAPAQMLGGLAQLASYRPSAVVAPRSNVAAPDVMPAPVPPARAPIMVADEMVPERVMPRITPHTTRDDAVPTSDTSAHTVRVAAIHRAVDTAKLIAARAPAAPDDSLADLTQAIGRELKDTRQPTLRQVSLR